MLFPAATSGAGIAVGVLCSVLLLACQTSGQSIPTQLPDDFHVQATAGGVAPWSVNHTLDIDSDGAALFTAARPGDIGAAPIEQRQFRLGASDVDTLWSAILRTDFFSLNPDYADEDVQGGSVAALTVTAHGRVHHVRIQNVSLAPFEDILRALNAVTPDDSKLVYSAPTE